MTDRRTVSRPLRALAATGCLLSVTMSGAVACSNDGAGAGSVSQGDTIELSTQTVANDPTGRTTADVFFPDAKSAIVVAKGADLDLAKRAADKLRVPVLINPTPEQLGEFEEVYPVGEVTAPEGSSVTVKEPLTSERIDELTAGDAPKFDSSTVVFLPKNASAANKINAATSGIEVLDLPGDDALVSSPSIKALKEDRTIIAIGDGFGDVEAARETAKNLTAELPGGGATLLPGRRIVALYGHPSGPDLGVLGEQDPKPAVKRAQQDVDAYQPFSPEPVIPGFEIIATVASEFAGDDGDFSNEAQPEELVPYLDAVTEAGGYAIIDLQPGTARFIDQAKRYEELLKRPNVGLALDPEWKLTPGKKPASEVGHTDAAEINEVVTWLADLTAGNNLPQKALVLHQFQTQMIRDRAKVDTSRKEIQIVLHADGHGSAGEKMATWDALLKDLPEGFAMAWKNFLDEDTPLFTPEQTMGVNPRPWFVSFQ